MVFERNVQKKIMPFLGRDEALVLTGARQVGKTTIARQIFNTLPEGQKVWFDFENPLDIKVFEDVDYADIYKRIIDTGVNREKRVYVFIDEIQYFPEITRIMKYLIDHYQVKFCVTCSSSFYMRNLFPESLSGKKFLFTITPLAFNEFLRFKGVKGTTYSLYEEVPNDICTYERFDEYYQEYLEYGGFPEVVLEQSVIEKKMILRNIFSSYFQKDVSNFGGFKNVSEVRDLILLVMQRVGQKIDVTKLASTLGVTRNRVYEYLYFLEQTFFITLLPQYSKSIDQSVAGGKKVFCVDSGMVNEIAQVSRGNLFENAVCNQLQAYIEDPVLNPIMYYQNRSSMEIDCVLDKSYALEVKLHAVPQDERRLARLAERTGIENYAVVSLAFAENLSFVRYPQDL
ncbi:MAG: ATP-binding protein [Candidatus Dojkabacteria bacterium]